MLEKQDFIVGVKTKEEANKINREEYRFERYSETLQEFLFIRRGGK